MKHLFKLSAASLCGLALFSCNSNKVGQLEKTKNGTEYILAKDVDGANIKIGDNIIFHFKLFNAKDSLLRSTYEVGMPTSFKLDSSKNAGPINEAFTLASKGDSIIIFEPVDSILKKYPMAKADKSIVPGTKLKYEIQILEVFDKSQDSLFQKANQKYYDLKMKKDQADAQKAMQGEPALIQAYIQKSKEKFEVQKEGYYLYKSNSTQGKQPQNGDKVKVHYTGMLLDGKKFDSSVDRGTPFEFELGVSQVIQGWHLGIAQLKVGEKAILLLPSNLAYGANGAGQMIKPFTPLLFEVELIEISKK